MIGRNKTGRPVKDRPNPLGRRLYELREEKGWAQEELAEKAGLSAATVCSTERGHDLTLFSAICLADALGCSLDYLVLGRGRA